VRLNELVSPKQYRETREGILPLNLKTLFSSYFLGNK